MRMHLFAALSLSSIALAAAGCGPKTEPNTADLTNPCPPGQLCPQPSASIPPTTTPPPPTATATSTAPASSSATPIPELGNTIAVTPILTAMGASEAPGMKADGTAFAGTFQEGQTLEHPINVQAGKCYTVVGASAGGIVELDVQLVAQAAPMPPLVLAQDNQTGPMAIIGSKGQCFRNPSPITVPGKVILKATKGNGIAGAQVFIK
ncbi:MAG: hypothetical protein U0359_18355 [Byssovorax sp.]